MKAKQLGWAALAAALLGVWALPAQNPSDPLQAGFRNPPAGARPRVWWHWMNGNITKEGIKLDFEWMKRVGIGGVQNFDAALNTPTIVEKRLVYMTPEWKDAFKYAATLADQLGLEMAIAGSPGWSESGGPWVPPAQAMKKYVWSETRVEGGRAFTGTLAKPPSTTGPFQNMGGRGGQPEFYADAAVVAFRAPEDQAPMANLQPKLTSSGGAFELLALTDGDYAKATLLPAAATDQTAWIQFEFDQPRTFRGLTLGIAGGGRGRGPQGGPALEASDDGQQFRPVAPIPGGVRDVAFPPATARFFRVVFPSPPPQAAGRGGAAPAPAGFQIAELVLHAGARVNNFEAKAAFSATAGPPDTPSVEPAAAIRKGDVIDLTGKMRPDGSLDWTPPDGRWVVLRLGYSLLGITNHPASPEATGLEVDKLSKVFVRNYFENYLNQYKDATGGLMGKRGLQYVITDSWEAGTLNWTDEMMPEFAKRRGYDMKPWLPVLAGRVVESAEASERFLWDFRKTIGDLTAEYHYDQLTTLLHERGMGRYTESHENGRAFVGDGMDVKRTADVPMSAMWTGGRDPDGAPLSYNADIRESASVAHIYGQNVLAAESLTAGSGAYTFSPETLKPTADAEMAMGLNRFVIHTSVHQPVTERRPGLSLGQYGQWFNRLETWSELAKPWVGYLARSSYMLQQGKFVADVLVYYGEDSNVTALFGNRRADVPAGYNYDFASSDVLLNRVKAADGRITTASGMSYRALLLDPNSQRMPLAVLRKIRDLANAGAMVVGPKPTGSPSLSDDQSEFAALADQLWGPGGKIQAGQNVAAALTAAGVAPDFEYSKPQPDTYLLSVHRKLADGEVYWVDNRRNRTETVDATFRVTGKAPELWRPDTGAIEPASYSIANGRTTVPLRLDPFDAVFVVFRRASAAPSRSLKQTAESAVAAIEGAWDVAFQPDRGAPPKITVESLASWSENADPGVKYFSGTGTYTKTVQAPADWFKTGAQLWLDLGDVKNLAEVSVNGKPLGIYWRAPFRVNVTGVLKPGANTVQIKVTNLWVNRIVGDQQPGATQKYTFTSMQYYRADSPLLPSGLLGPVQVVRVM
ncbi:MAG: discoidin domain-containing protein [Acidobacteriia bacterium]|nr:discoidin domain-containing protein [Terriglobia bacterium]